MDYSIIDETLSTKWDCGSRNLFNINFKPKDYISVKGKRGNYILARVLRADNNRIFVQEEKSGKLFFVSPFDKVSKGYNHFKQKEKERKIEARLFEQDCYNDRARALNRTKEKEKVNYSNSSIDYYQPPYPVYNYNFTSRKPIGKVSTSTNSYTTPLRKREPKPEPVFEPYDIRIITEEEYQLLSEQKAYHKYLNQIIKKERIEKELQQNSSNKPGAFIISEQRIKRYNNKYIKPEDLKLLEEINKKYDFNVDSFYDCKYNSNSNNKNKNNSDNSDSSNNNSQQEVLESAEQYNQDYQQSNNYNNNNNDNNNYSESNPFVYYIHPVKSENETIDYSSIYSSMYNSSNDGYNDYNDYKDSYNYGSNYSEDNYSENQFNQEEYNSGDSISNSSSYNYNYNISTTYINIEEQDYSVYNSYSNDDDQYYSGYSLGLNNEKVENELENEEIQKDEIFKRIEKDYKLKTIEDYSTQYEKLLNTFSNGFILHNEFHCRRIELAREYFNIDLMKYK